MPTDPSSAVHPPLPTPTESGGQYAARRARGRTVLGAAGGLIVLLAGCSVGAGSPSTSTSAGSPVVTSTATSALAAPTTTTAAAAPGHAIPAPSGGKWQLNGSAKLSAGSVVLTTARIRTAGSAIWPHPLRGITSLSASFDVQMDGGTGADGATFALINASTGRSTSLGKIGGGLGWAGIPGRAVAFDTFQNPGDPSYNDVGLIKGFNPEQPDQLTWADSATAIPQLRGGIRHITVVVEHGLLTVTVGAAVAFTAPLALPATLLVGFTAATGARTDRHVVSNVDITAS